MRSRVLTLKISYLGVEVSREQDGLPCIRVNPLREGRRDGSSACIVCRTLDERQVNKFQSHFTLSNLCTLPLALNGPTLALKRTARMLACHNQCRHTETVVAINAIDRVQRECRSRKFNKKNGRHHAQHRCYLGRTSQRMDHLKIVAH